MTEFDIKFKAENTEFNTNFGEVSIVTGDYIPVPSTAEVGQTIVVKAVDENGKPTEWEAVDLPNNEKFIVTFSGDGSPYVCDKTMDEIVNAYENGQDISAYFTGTAPNGTNYTNLLLSLTMYDPGASIWFESDIEIYNLYRIGASIDATGFCDVFDDTALDNSLTNNNMAANAKVVGDALARKQDTLIQSGAAIGQIARITAVDINGKPTEWEAVDMPSGGGVEIDISREPNLILELSEAVVSLSISEINGQPINATEMVVLWEHPGGAQYIPNYFRFNNEVKNSTVADTAIANFNFPASACPSSTNAAAILCRVKKINNGTYWYEYSGLQQNAGTITGGYPAVYGAPYRNILIGETSIKEFYVYQSSKIQEGCKVSIWVK